MKTLYDLLGALPDDDAEELRSAFRKAVKGTHPDINPGDPDAALRFRQIVRANDILSDRDQRAAYDHLLDLAREEQEQESKRAVAAKVHKVASGVMAIAGAAATTVGGYLLFMHVSAASIAPLKPIVVTTDKIKIIAVATKPVELAALAPEPAAPAAGDAAVETVASLPEKATQPAASEQADSMNSADDDARAHCASVPGSNGCPAETAAGPANTSAAAGAPGVNDAKFYRDRGMASYRKGDLAAAVADLDQAIQIDPKFSAAYVDRGAVLYRMGKFDRAFADVASAKRIEKTNRAVMDAMARKQPLRPLKLDPPKLTRVSQRRTSVAD
ncbi:DnaJ domain-containing protein [Bradyrhizobium sp. STM 3557]|uniref:DnaJ domain-containing protein n=1 Tax=Bradyrhizobium sp. STM 3557 TaxID=578920 RepID=UPI0038900431